MLSEDDKDFLLRAGEEPEILGTDKYIDIQLGNGFSRLTLQMGPNCNRSCFHCYGKFGPDRIGLPSVSVVGKALEEAVEIGLEEVSVTDGEPFREENRRVVEKITGYSSRLPTFFITNGSFAGTLESSLDWFYFLKDSGFGLENEGNSIEVSCGTMYPTDSRDFWRISEGLRQVYGDIDFGNHLSYRLIAFDGDNSKQVFENVVGAVGYVFGMEDISASEKKDCLEILMTLKNRVTPMKIRRVYCRPVGRASQMTSLQKKFPLRKVESSDLGFFPDFFGSLWIGHDGRVSFGSSGRCIYDGKIYGNVQDDSLEKIKQRISSDPVYIGFKLGGVRFIHFLVENIHPEFVGEGRTRCDVCASIFSDSGLVGEVRKKLDSCGVVESYKGFIEQFDIGEKKYF